MKQRLLRLLILFSIGGSGYLILRSSRSYQETEIFNSDKAVNVVSNIQPKLLVPLTKNFTKIHFDRVNHIQEMCHNTTIFNNTAYVGNTLASFYYSKKYNFTYCKVPKAGCTFWSQVFNILKLGVHKSKGVFKAPRSAIHILSAIHTIRYNRKERQNSRAIIVSRDPFSRLYSAYIDKVYLTYMFDIKHKQAQQVQSSTSLKLEKNAFLDENKFDKYTESNAFEMKSNHTNLTLEKSTYQPENDSREALVDNMFEEVNQTIGNDPVTTEISGGEESECTTNDVTFQEFIEYVIDAARNGESLNSHIAPIFSLCRVCDINAFIVVKQETFSDDFAYSLKSIGVEKEIYDVLIEAMHSRRVEATVPGIVATVFSTFNAHRINCLGWSGVAQRVWKSFQIQGYLDETVPFPTDTVDTIAKTANMSSFTDVLLNVIQSHPLSSAMSRSQRNMSLVNAYDGITEESIRGIQNVYFADFQLFEYSQTPPNKR